MTPETINSSPVSEPNEQTIGQAIAYVHHIMQECAVMGTNDSEIPHLMSLIEKISAKEITLEEACKLARAIRDAKQDYR